jgi:hypothetical protein
LAKNIPSLILFYCLEPVIFKNLISIAGYLILDFVIR